MSIRSAIISSPLCSNWIPKPRNIRNSKHKKDGINVLSHSLVTYRCNILSKNGRNISKSLQRIPVFYSCNAQNNGVRPGFILPAFSRHSRKFEVFGGRKGVGLLATCQKGWRGGISDRFKILGTTDYTDSGRRTMIYLKADTARIKFR